jgi:dienelactone hydrolase
MTAALSRSAEPAPAGRPPVVAICGSTRFQHAMTVVNRRLTLAGRIVLAPGVFIHTGDPVTDAEKSALDELHLRKIDLADSVVVINLGGYIGESTRREITYARGHGKLVSFLVDATGTPRAWYRQIGGTIAEFDAALRAAADQRRLAPAGGESR